MVVFIVGQHIEDHTAKHFIYLLRVLRQVAGEVKQSLIIQLRIMNGFIEQTV